MYRYRVHMVVRDVASWNEAVDLARQTNVISERLGQPTLTLWTETIGQFNHLVAETEYDSLASLESSFKAMEADTEFQEVSRRVAPLLVADKGYTELLERAEQVTGIFG